MKFRCLRDLRYKGKLGFFIAKTLHSVLSLIDGACLNDKAYISKKFSKFHGYRMNWNNPQSLNEKLQVLKSYYNKKLHTIVSDKFAVRAFIQERFGDDFLIPLVFVTSDPVEINEKSIPDFPVIIKANHDAGNNIIIRDKANVDWKKLQIDCSWWLTWNYYYSDREQQYKNIERRIIVEKLLITNDGKIPNDYKLNYIDGNLEFVYVALDREDGNFRNIYDSNWNPIYFKWAKKSKMYKTKRGVEVSPPQSWELMKVMGAEIAKLFPYVRVDFYDVDGELFFGEITLCHGGGFDSFEPKDMDFILGRKLFLK